MQFTREVEENGKLPFLDCLVSRDHISFRWTSPPTTRQHKATTIRTLTRRTQLVCNTTDRFSNENKCLDFVFSKNSLQRRLRPTNHSPTYYNCRNRRHRNSYDYSDYTIHKGISGNVSRILQLFNIRVAHKPVTTIRQLLTNAGQRRHEPRNRQGAVYKINCSDCRNVSYHCRQQSFSRLHSHRRSNCTILFIYLFFCLSQSWFGFFFNRRATFPPVKKDFRYAR